ncbi:MAG: PIG-L family deacetylase [Elusimicrobia bacterium]|nr:PIG-L family deacetylase [Elusimicrobiota bacterium]
MKVLVVSAHPDDETLGCGATLLKHRAEGDRLHWLIATQAHQPQWSASVIKEKLDEIGRVAKAYAMPAPFRLGFPSARLNPEYLSEAIRKISEVLAKVKPEVVYVVHGGDVHTDHQIVFQATAAALKPYAMARFGVRRLLSYETLSSTNAAAPVGGQAFVPTVFNDIGRLIDQKIKIMNLYKTEKQSGPGPRSSAAIRALAGFRGSTINARYAEAFMLVREVMS